MLSKALDDLTPADVPVEQINTLFLQNNPGSAAAVFSYSRSLWAIKGQSVLSDVEESVLQLARPELQPSIEVSHLFACEASISPADVVDYPARAGVSP